MQSRGISIALVSGLGQGQTKREVQEFPVGSSPRHQPPVAPTDHQGDRRKECFPTDTEGRTEGKRHVIQVQVQA